MSRSSTSTRPSPTRRTRRCKGGLSIEGTMSQGGRDMTKDDIRSAIAVVYDQIFNQGQADLLPGLVSGPYIQHNPLFPNGLDGILGYIKRAGRIPCEVKRMAIDSDLAFVHVRYLDWGGQETAGVDIFRFDDVDGKIVEHWDVLQPVPAASNNANTMF